MNFYTVKEEKNNKIRGVYGDCKEDVERKIKKYLLKNYIHSHRHEIASEYKKGVYTYSEYYNFSIKEFKNENIIIYFNYYIFDGITEKVLNKTETIFLEELRLIN